MAEVEATQSRFDKLLDAMLLMLKKKNGESDDALTPDNLTDAMVNAFNIQGKAFFRPRSFGGN